MRWSVTVDDPSMVSRHDYTITADSEADAKLEAARRAIVDDAELKSPGIVDAVALYAVARAEA